jgi:hypothetical protein
MEKTGDKALMTLLRSKVTLCREGRFLCDDCNKGVPMQAGPAPNLQVTKKAKYGCYLGKKDGAVGHQTTYAIHLLPVLNRSKEGGKCQLQCLIVTPDSVTKWIADGTYEEVLGGSGDLESVAFTCETSPSEQGAPAQGQVFNFGIEKGATNERLTCEGISCPLQLGLQAEDLRKMMQPPRREAVTRPEGAATVSEENVPAGFYSLAQLQDGNIWKAAGLDANTREMYLSDETFNTVFGMSKSEFEGQPKWKRDAAKKKQGLF